MASLSEEVLLVIKKVRQRKQDGTLYLMAERIAWGPEGKDRFSVSHLYSDIRCESWMPSSHSLCWHTFVPLFSFQAALCCCPVQVRRSALTAKPKFSFSWSFTPARVPHSTLPMRAPHSKTERLSRNYCSSYCPSSRRKPTRSWKRKTGENLVFFRPA